MGDLRYYTYEQFFSTIGYTLLIMYLVLVLGFCYYRYREDRLHNLIFLQLVILLVSASLKLVEELYMFEMVCKQLRLIQMSLFIMNHVVLLYFVATIQRQHIRKKYIWLLFCFCFLIGCGAYGFREQFISYYDIIQVEYTRLYWYIVGVIDVLMICLVLLIIKRVKSNIKHNDIKYYIQISAVLILLPDILYLILAPQYVELIEIISIITMSLWGLGILNRQSTTSVAPFLFERVSECLDNYVVVLNDKEQVVFINNTEVFKPVESFLGDINDLFIGTTEWTKDNYIRLQNNNEIKYLLKKEKALYNHKAYIGCIMTFVDVTELRQLLTELQGQESTTESVNKQLLNHKETVYEYEKEKEVNKLLEEINRTQEQNMKLIMARLDEAVVTKRFTDKGYLDQLIDMCQNNLDTVRKAVTTYSTHYNKGGL